VGSAAYRYHGAAGHLGALDGARRPPQSFHIEGVMFQIRNVNGCAPFPEDRGWKDTVWVDGQVELLVYYAQPSWPHFPFQYLSQTLELADRGSIGQMLVNPAP
jgi:suppressor of ftsI